MLIYPQIMRIYLTNRRNLEFSLYKLNWSTYITTRKYMSMWRQTCSRCKYSKRSHCIDL